jgi:putative (di)nucleoside polyphosphate hydrolase
MNDLPYRPNVCILLFNKEKKLLLGERKGCPGIWQFPQGGVELDQSIEGNVIREIKEELGLSEALIEIVGCLKARHRYDFDVAPAYADGIWRGQDQTFWLVRFIGSDSDISLDSHDPEFDSWCWATPREVRSRAEKKRVTGYEAALKEFEVLGDSL